MAARPRPEHSRRPAHNKQPAQQNNWQQQTNNWKPEDSKNWQEWTSSDWGPSWGWQAQQDRACFWGSMMEYLQKGFRFSQLTHHDRNP